MDFVSITIGILLLVGAGRAMILGGASADGFGIRRDEMPFAFWTIVCGSTVVAGFLILKGIKT